MSSLMAREGVGGPKGEGVGGPKGERRISQSLTAEKTMHASGPLLLGPPAFAGKIARGDKYPSAQGA